MQYELSKCFDCRMGVSCVVKQCFLVKRRRHRLTQLLTLMAIIAGCLCQRRRTTTGTTAKGKFTFTSPVPNRYKARASMKAATTLFPSTITTPTSVYFDNGCYYIYHYCMKYEKTGMMCLRGPYFQYFTVNSGCELHYLNCMEHYDVYMIAYMGECFNTTVFTKVYDAPYPYQDDYFLDMYYVVPEDHV